MKINNEKNKHASNCICMEASIKIMNVLFTVENSSEFLIRISLPNLFKEIYEMVFKSLDHKNPGRISRKKMIRGALLLPTFTHS